MTFFGSAGIFSLGLRGMPNTLFIFISLVGVVVGFPARKASLTAPPIRNDYTLERGGGGFTGYRQVFKDECKDVTTQWQRQMGVVSGVSSIENFEMLRLIEDCAAAMPGAKPQRREIVAWGEFEEGTIRTISVGYLSKVKCPWELQMLAIVTCPRNQKVVEDRSNAMVEWLSEVCKENAIWPDYTLMDKWLVFRDKKWVRLSLEQTQLYSGKTVPPSAESLIAESPTLHEAIKALYKDANPSPSLVLDGGGLAKANNRVPPFWCRHSLQNPLAPQMLYFRQRRGRTETEEGMHAPQAQEADSDEGELVFDVRFDPPVTGVSTGMPTVGCFVVIDADSPTSASQYLHSEKDLADLRDIASRLELRVRVPPLLLDPEAVADMARRHGQSQQEVRGEERERLVSGREDLLQNQQRDEM